MGHCLFVALMAETDEVTSQEEGKLYILNMYYGSIPVRGEMFSWCFVRHWCDLCWITVCSFQGREF